MQSKNEIAEDRNFFLWLCAKKEEEEEDDEEERKNGAKNSILYVYYKLNVLGIHSCPLCRPKS